MCPFRLLQPVNCSNAWVVQRGEDLGFSLESPQAFFVLGELVGKDFDRHIPAELPIPGPIDLPHPTFANGLEDLVVGELKAGLEGHVEATMLQRCRSIGNY